MFGGPSECMQETAVMISVIHDSCVQASSSWIVDPRNVQVLILGMLFWRIIQIILLGLWCHHSSCYKRDTMEDWTGKDIWSPMWDAMMDDCCKEDGRSHEPQNASNIALGSEKMQEHIFSPIQSIPWFWPIETNSGLLTTPSIENEWMCVALDVSLWQFVTTAKGNLYKGFDIELCTSSSILVIQALCCNCSGP